MKIVNLFATFTIAFILMTFAGCSSNRQYLDPLWTQKPAKMKILFTKPVIMVGKEKIETPDPALDYFWRSTGDPELPVSMEAASGWFRNKVDNVMQFNSNVPSVVEFVPENKISRVIENMDGVEVYIPKVESMSDSFDVYLFLDDIEMSVSKSVRTMNMGAGVNMAGGINPATGLPSAAHMGPTFKGEFTKINADYVIYDVKTGKRLAYGHLEDEMYHEDVSAESGLYENVRDLMLKILGQTPVTRFK